MGSMRFMKKDIPLEQEAKGISKNPLQMPLMARGIDHVLEGFDRQMERSTKLSCAPVAQGVPRGPGTFSAPDLLTTLSLLSWGTMVCWFQGW